MLNAFPDIIIQLKALEHFKNGIARSFIKPSPSSLKKKDLLNDLHHGRHFHRTNNNRNKQISKSKPRTLL